LILARDRDRSLAGLELRDVRTAAEAAQLCDRITATGALEASRDRALGLVAAAKASLPRLRGRQLEALELVADGVVERYS
jgi:geranylgeranyl pyrophosphate synthase